MKMEALFEKYGCDTQHKEQAVFASIFILQNRLQTAGEKLQTEISVKQWLLLAMAECCPEPRTLTNIGEVMGCSRQNIKKLAAALEKKGFVRLVSGNGRSVQVVLTEKAELYEKKMAERQRQLLELLFADFDVKETDELFRLYARLYMGMERAEKYAEEFE